jgi:CspA family cold shock protein
MATGRVKTYISERGFGFLKPDEGGADVFFHVSQCSDGDDISVGDAVRFEVGVDGRSGKLRATSVELVEDVAR